MLNVILTALFLFKALALGSVETNLVERVTPFIMTESHPLKGRLDQFFQHSRWTFNEKTLKSAGFTSYHPRKFSRVIVTKHPDFPGYVFKIYLDTQRYYLNVPEWEIWARRAEGALSVRNTLKEMAFEDVMKAPIKWIYRLPENPKPPKGYLPKRYILVQEDMELVSTEENTKMWGSDLVTKELLDKVKYVLQNVGLLDCAKIHNIPFSKDGRVAFIDTQSHHAKTVSWEGLNNYLTDDNKRYWKEITHQKQ